MNSLKEKAYKASYLISLILAIMYGISLMNTFSINSEGDFFSLVGVAQLFRHKEIVLVGWIHFLAFDLFVGSTIVYLALKNQLRYIWNLISLVATLMYGPLGLILFIFSLVIQRKLKNLKT